MWRWLFGSSRHSECKRSESGWLGGRGQFAARVLRHVPMSGLAVWEKVMHAGAVDGVRGVMAMGHAVLVGVHRAACGSGVGSARCVLGPRDEGRQKCQSREMSAE